MRAPGRSRGCVSGWYARPQCAARPSVRRMAA
jgi:hypothetical protein